MSKVKWNRRTISVALLAVVLPTAVFAVSRLLGGGTVVARNITLEAVEWEFERRNRYFRIRDTINGSYADGEVSTKLQMIFLDYLPKIDSREYDTILIQVNVNTTTTGSNSFVKSVYVTFVENSTASKVSWDSEEFIVENLTITNLEGRGTEKGAKASITLESTDSPNIYFSSTILWKLYTPISHSHQMKATYEITYYNGTAFCKVTQPFQLNILGQK
jgi:hypothetical protein